MGDAAPPPAARLPKPEDPHFFSWTGDWSALPAATLGALALGGGGRFLRGLWEGAQEDPGEVSGKIRRPEAPVADIPVVVSKEEAEELRRKGIRVRRALKRRTKTAGDAPPEPSFWKSLGYGGAVAGAGLAGWELADWLIDNLRKSHAQSDVKRTRRRLTRLLDADPEDRDIKVAAALALAEEQISKTAQTKGWLRSTGEKAYDLMPETDQLGPFWDGLKATGGLAIGAGTLLSFLAGMRKAKSESKHKKRVSDLGRFLRGKKVEAPVAVMQPVVYE